MTSPFYPPEAGVPAGLRTPEVALRMLGAADVERDYEAVVSSRETLWLRSGDSWPREGFTLAENLADLEQHEREHRARTAFTYTVSDPAGTLCLGCVYVIPLKDLIEGAAMPDDDETVRAAARVGIGAHDAAVSFWVRQSRLGSGLDGRLFAALHAWFVAEWQFSRVTYIANRRQERHQEIYRAAGLVPLYALTRTLVYA